MIRVASSGAANRRPVKYDAACVLPIASVRIGERHRKDMGDVAALADSIRDVGLLHPIVVTPGGQLIAGERRLAACNLLGWTKIPATTVALDEIVRGEFAENAIRKDFLPSEIDAILRALEPKEKAAAKARQGKRTDLAPTSGKVSRKSGREERARDKIAAFAGVSGRTVDKIGQVVDAAKRDPKKFGALAAEMDRTGKVDGAYRKLKQKQDEGRRLAIVPVVGKHRTIVIDPPWDHEGLSLAGRGRPEYAVMSQDELLRLPVGEWADDDCHLYLWTTNNFLPRAFPLIDRWGFAYKTCLTWVKPRIGLGSYFRSSTEHCLFALKGEASTRVKDIPTHFEAPIGVHSEKPETFFGIAERASYPPYLEVFSRRQREGWSAWGSGVADAA